MGHTWSSSCVSFEATIGSCHYLVADFLWLPASVEGDRAEGDNFCQAFRGARRAGATLLSCGTATRPLFPQQSWLGRCPGPWLKPREQHPLLALPASTLSLGATPFVIGWCCHFSELREVFQVT